MMTEISDTELLELNKKGIVPGPGELIEDFTTRARYCLSLKEKLTHELNDKIPFKAEELNADKTLEEPLTTTRKLFDIKPLWTPVFFSNHKLSPLHGGCAWIFQMSDSSPTSAFLQLRRSLKEKNQIFGLYDRDEIITHELAHAGRMTFEEPKFEEHLAYTTSSSRFRRFFGPIIQSGKESLLFVILLMMILFADMGLIASGDPEAFQKIMFINLIPFSFILMGLIRLFWRKTQLSKCKKNLNIFPQDHIPHILYRLTDKEISDFSKMSKEQILDYIDNQTCLRWRLIKTAYTRFVK